MRDLPLRFALRKILAAYVRRTRNYIYALATKRSGEDLVSLKASLARNTDELVDALRPVIKAGADRLGGALRNHAALGVEFFTALRRGDKAETGRASARWYANAGEVAAAFEQANTAWRRDEIGALFRKHLALTTEEAEALNSQDWMAFSEAYRRAFNHMIRFADFVAAEAERGKEGGNGRG